MAKWFLYDSNTGERVAQFPVTRPDFRGDEVTVTGGRPPLHRGSTGRIYTDEGREFYPSVVDLEWRDDDASDEAEDPVRHHSFRDMDDPQPFTLKAMPGTPMTQEELKAQEAFVSAAAIVCEHVTEADEYEGEQIAREAAEAQPTSPEPMITLGDILEWLETGMINDVHYDQQSIVDAIRETINKSA